MKKDQTKRKPPSSTTGNEVPKYQRNEANTYDLIKAIGVITMVIDHFGLFGFGGYECRLIGRLSAPIFFYLIGYQSSHEIRLKDVLWVAFFSALNYHYDFYIHRGNILIGLLVWKTLLKHVQVEKLHEIVLAIIFVLSVYFVEEVRIFLEYGSLPLVFAIGGKLSRFQQRGRIIWLVFAAGFHFYRCSPFFTHRNFIGDKIFVGSLIVAYTFVFSVFRIESLGIQKRFPFVDQSLRFLSSNSLQIYVIHLIGYKFHLMASILKSQPTG